MTIEARSLDAFLFDLDGVVTSTASLHVAAWKETFDRFLEERCGTAFKPFDVDADYARFVDGRLRQDGVSNFLTSRNISLPLGQPTDAPGFQTVWSLGNLKNERYRELVAQRGVHVFPDARELVTRLKQAGIATGLVTASRNCPLIVEAAGLSELFDVVLDGNDVARMGLAGKPEPDMYQAAARALVVEPGRAAVLEDSPAGIAAAIAGGFRYAIKVSRGASEEPPLPGALVVTDLDQIRLLNLPSALEALEEIWRRLRDRPHAVLLDYDGTLTPIVDRPELAVLSDDMREVLARLAAVCPTGIVTGRSLADIRKLVDLDVSFVASHGLEIQLQGQAREMEATPEVERSIAEVADAIEARIGSIPGLLVERKPFSVAVHYRLVDEIRVPEIDRALEAQREAHAGLRLLKGKKVSELRPDTDWDKGKAVLALAERLGVSPAGVLYIGDDVTDEDAFRVLAGSGTAIAVLAEERDTEATYMLRGEDGVRRFLKGLLEHFERHEAD